ncbi:hypothetical protein NC653_033527 [Populus alba x Populus x berolinensis]|uniref:Uncharacterized protein n=1 Tax=Populus alba x Populus x berolinensis TaxID=444605 RepID=A0AAD6LTW1_9ROSI|nr:hypothetical protein NC653_033527 [Populus alba x Populus x berolinensis]
MAATAASSSVLMMNVPQTRAPLTPPKDDTLSRKNRINLIQPRRFPLIRFHPNHHQSWNSVSSKRWSHEIATGGSRSLRKKNNALKQCSSSLGERVVGASFPEQFKCMSCSFNRRRSHYSIKGSTPTIPRAFVDKSAFNLSGHSLDTASVKHVHVPCTSMGPNEPHAASIGCPDGILERQDSDLLDSELERARLFEFLHSELPCHPKLHRGQLKNGLRYLILPNKVPPNRFEAHMEVHAGSIDEEDDEQGIAHMIEHVAFLGSKKREKLLGTGARSNAYTDFHHTVFHIHSPTSTKDADGDLLPSVLDALNEIAFHPSFLASRVEKERRAILSELQMMNTIEYRVDCQVQTQWCLCIQHLHSENKLSKRFPIGLEEQIKKWDADKIRKFHERWYLPANATLYIVGDIDNISKAVHQIENVFGQTGLETETVSAPSPSAFGAMASFLVPKLSVGLPGSSSREKSSSSLDQSKIIKKERHAIRPPVEHYWSLPGSNANLKPPQIFQHEFLQNFSINMFCKKLWDEDPHEYVRKGYDIIEDLYSPRTASMDFVSELVRKRGKENLQKFILFVVEIFKRYDEAPLDYKPYRQKDGALLAIGALCDKLKQTDPYKSELERMLVQHVFPEFSSPAGHLRAKAAWVAGQYAHINFSDQNNFRKALHSVVSGLRDPELPVRVDSVFALRSFVEACKDLSEIRPILPQLLDEFFKLMNEVENEDLVFTLETIVDKFGEEMAPYALGLCQNLAAAFWRCMNTAEADDEADDPGALAAVGCLRAISTILESVSRLPDLFVQIEPTLLPIMRRMLTTDGQEVFEEVLEIVSYMTFFSPTISTEMWSLWPLMIEALADWAIDFFPNILVPLDNYISRGTAHFLACREPDYQQSLWKMISYIMADKNLEDNDIEPAPKLIEVVFQNCKGQVDQWVEPYMRITVERLRRTEKSYLKCLLMQVVADALYYNPALTLSILHKLGVATEIFNLWFQMLQQVKKSGVRANFKREHDKKVCCLGLTSLLALPADQLPGEALGPVFTATLDLLVQYKDQLAEAAKEEEAEDLGDMGGFQTDDEDDDGDGSDKEMGVDAEDGDEADSIKLHKLAAQQLVDVQQLAKYSEVSPVPVPLIVHDEAMQALDPLRFQNLTQTLDFHFQALANGVAEHAEQRRVVIGKEKLEKTSAASAL